MPISKDHLVDVLRVRYDAYSAEAVFTNACARAGLDGTTSFDQRSLATFRAALEQVGDRVGGVLSRIDALLADGSPAAEPSVEPKAEPEKKAKTKAEKATEPTVDKAAKPTREQASAPTVDKAGAPTPETTIVLRGLELDEGEQLFVCGAHPTIGDWEPDGAHPMTRVGAEWLAMLELPPEAEVAFKFLVRDAAGEVTWEAGGNRTVRASEQLDATWRELS